MIAKTDGKRVKYLSLKYKDYFKDFKSDRRFSLNLDLGNGEQKLQLNTELDDNEQALVDRILAGIDNRE